MRCKVTSSLACSLANYGFKGIVYSSRCCSKISCIRWVIFLLFFAMFLGISSAIFFAKCVKFSAIFSSTTYTKTAELEQLHHGVSRFLCLFLQWPCSTDVILLQTSSKIKSTLAGCEEGSRGICSYLRQSETENFFVKLIVTPIVCVVCS